MEEKKLVITRVRLSYSSSLDYPVAVARGVAAVSVRNTSDSRVRVFDTHTCARVYPHERLVNLVAGSYQLIYSWT